MCSIKYEIIGPKILLVDDDPTNIKILKKMLELNHYRNTRSTTKSEKTIDIVKEYKPDLILLDLRMPVMDGYEVLLELKKKVKDQFIPVIMITAENDKVSKYKALELGVDQFISKPFDQEEVLLHIKNALEVKLRHNKIDLQNRVLLNRLEEEKEGIEILQMDLINRLLKAAEFRDNNTGEHVTRIGLYVSELSKLLNMPDKFCREILYASMLHDIGKIGIPDHILLKEERLTEGEWAVMRQHTIKGAQILDNSQSEILQMGEKIALCHHERWDGNGYPYGVSKYDIPIESRLTTICDVFDALLSCRCYKMSWPIEMTVEEIRKGRGTNFDPEITDVFLDNVNVFLKIANDFMSNDFMSNEPI